MKKKLIAIGTALLMTAALGMTACGDPSEPELTDEALKGTTVADFTKGATDAVFESDGWSNGSVFNVVWAKENVKYGTDAMHLGITKENRTAWIDNEEVEYEYTAGEARTTLHYGYGDFDVSMKPAKKVGTASTFFTCTGPYDTDLDGNPQKHDEIDIEFLGKDTTKVQFNYFVNGQGGHEHMYDLGFDASAEYHAYGYRWTKDYIVWFVDGKPVYKVEASADNELPSAPGRMLMNYWCGTEDAEGWMGEYAGPNGESADYQWIKTSATGVDLSPAPEVPDGAFEGDWSEIENTDLTFKASDEKYTVAKTDNVTNITYTAVKGNDYINVNAPVTQAAAEKNWLHLTLTNNAETDVQVRVNMIDDALAGAEKNKSSNLGSFMDGEVVRTDLEWGGSFFDIPAGKTVKAEIYFGGTPDSLELMIDSSRNDGKTYAGDISVSNVKFAKQGDIIPVEPVLPADKPALTVNESTLTFDGDLSTYDATADSDANTLNVKYADLADMTYKNIWTAATDVARTHNVFSVKITNNGTESVSVRIDIESVTQKANTTACNLSATQDGESVYTDLEWGGSTFTVATGATVVAKVTYDTTAGPTNVKFFFDSSIYKENEADKTTHTGDVTLSEMAFEGEGSYTPKEPDESGSTTLTFTSNDVYNVTPGEDSVTVTYTEVGGQSYRNISTGITSLAEGKNTFSVKIKNNGTDPARIRIDVQGATKVENTDACNTNAWADGHDEVYTDTNWGGSFITVAADEEITFTIVYDGAGDHGAAQALLIFIDSSTNSDDTHSGSITLSNFVFSLTEAE